MTNAAVNNLVVRSPKFEKANLRPANQLGVDELNLAEFPLAACGYKVSPEQKTLIFEDTIFDEGQRQAVKRKLIIAASEAWGLPTPVDSDVLLVLMHLTRIRNGFTNRKVLFSRYELIQLLGWNDSGRSYHRLDHSLQRWASVTLSYNKSWWDKLSQVWRTRTFHVVESLDLRGRVDRNRDNMQSSFTWNEVLFESFGSNNLKRLDLKTYFSLERPVSRQMFRFLDKRFYRSSKLELDLRYFGCEHVGLSRNYDNSQLQRRLLPALRELEQIGFLTPLSNSERFKQIQRREWKIILIANPQFSKQSKGQRLNPVNDDNQKLQVELERRGVGRRVASELTSGFPVSHVQKKIEDFDRLISAKDKKVSKNGAGYLVMSIRDNYEVPPTAGEVSKPPSTNHTNSKRRPTAKELQRAKLEAEQEAQLDEWLKGLTDAELKEAEAEAVANATSIKIESYYRLMPTGGALFESLRRQLLADLRKFQMSAKPHAPVICIK